MVPPSKVSTTAATPAANSAFEINPARQSPNAADMISIARGNELNTTQAHAKSFRPDVTVLFPEPAIEYVRAALTAMSRRKSTPTAVLEAVAAAPQDVCKKEVPGGYRTFLVPHWKAANHRRLRTANPKKIAAIRIRALLPL